MTFSLAFLTLKDCGPIEAIKAAATAGYDRIGLRLLPATSAEREYPLIDDDRLLQDVLSLLDDTGLRVGDVELVRITRSFSAGTYEAFLERAAKLGADHIVIVIDDHNATRAVENLGSLCQLAGQYNLKPEIEPMTWTAAKNLADAMYLINQIRNENAGILIDALHFYRSTSKICELESLDQKRLRLFQICDALLSYDQSIEGLKHVSRGERLRPGEGELDLASLLYCLPDEITISVEVPNDLDIASLTPLQRAKRALYATKSVLAQANASKTQQPTDE